MLPRETVTAHQSTGTGHEAPMKTPRWLQAVLWVALVAAIAAGLGLHILNLTRRAVNYDENVYLHFTWLTGQGILPRDGFLCPYPPTAFYLFAPLLNLVPQKPELFVALRAGTLPFLALYVGALCVMARFLRRHAGVTAAYAMVFIGSGLFTSLWELRFDLISWSLAMAGMALLLRNSGRLAIAGASALVCLSVMISPKHAFFAAGLAIAVAILRITAGWKSFAHDTLAALGGASIPVLVLTCIRPAFLLDCYDLTLMNYLTQLKSTYSTTLMESLWLLFARDPIALSPIWAGPVLFLLHGRDHDRKTVVLYAGALLGCVATVAGLPCGYDQYVTLAWALFAVFFPWMAPRRDRPWLPVAITAGLLVLVSVYAQRDLPLLRDDSPMSKYIKLQRELARLCPPGEVSVSRPFAQVWFRRTPGYVYIDNNPSYRSFVHPDKLQYFTSDYFYNLLAKEPPAYFCWFTAADGQPQEYNQGCARFLSTQATNYVFMGIPCELHSLLEDKTLVVHVRKDLASNAVTAIALSPGEEEGRVPMGKPITLQGDVGSFIELN